MGRLRGDRANKGGIDGGDGSRCRRQAGNSSSCYMYWTVTYESIAPYWATHTYTHSHTFDSLNLVFTFLPCESAKREWHKGLRDEVTERLRDMSHQWTDDRAELDRRMILSEKIVEGVASKLQMSKEVVEGFFSTSPDIRKFQAVRTGASATYKWISLIIRAYSRPFVLLRSCLFIVSDGRNKVIFLVRRRTL